MPRRIALIATSLALLVVLAGCGSDDDSADDRDTTTTTEEEASSTTKAEDETEETTAPEETTTEATETTEAPDESTTTVANSGDGNPEFCAAYEAFEASAADLPSETVEDIQAGATALRDGIGSLEPLAPEELADDMDLLLEATEDVYDAAMAATTVDEARAALSDVFSNEEFSGAAERVNTYYDEHCPQANDDQAEAPETVTPG